MLFKLSRVLKFRFVGLVCLSATLSSFAIWGDRGAQIHGAATEGNLVHFGKGGVLIDSGISPAAVTNAAAVAAVLSTNTVSSIVFDSEKGQPNGVAGLDENGKINESTIPSIIIVYTGDDELQ